MTALMSLKVLLPYQVFVARADVSRIVAETRDGSFGLLPQRLDCVAALVPGILMYATATDGEVFLAVDGGVLVKSGREVLISVRRAIGGTALDRLHDVVRSEFLALDEQERETRQYMARLETGFLERFVALRHE